MAGAAESGSTHTTVPIRGVVRAVRQATISTDTPLRALELPFREGNRFKRGDTLALFDCRRQKADLDAATAVGREAVLVLDSNIQLDRHNAIGRNDVEIARARAEKARAEIAGLATRLDECRVVAQYDGRITELAIRVDERTVPQKPFISMIDDSKLEIEFIAPSAMFPALQPGTPFSFRIDELGGRVVEAEVGSLGARVDPISKTIKVIGIIKQHESEALSGMSGTANFSPEVKR